MKTPPAERLALCLPWVATAGLLVWLRPPLWRWDEWDFLAWWLDTRSRGPDLAALWAQHNEHRPVLIRALFYIHAELGWGALPLMLLSLAALAASFLLLLPLVRAATEGWSPARRNLVLLVCSSFAVSWAQWENFLMGMQVGVSCALFGILLALRGQAAPPSLRANCEIALGLALAYVSVAHWVVLIPVLVVQRSWGCWNRRAFATGPRWRSVVALAAALAALLAIYLSGYARPAHHPGIAHFVTYPLESIGFLLAFYGNPFALGNLWLPRAMGVLFTVASLFVVVQAHGGLVWRRTAAFPLGALAAMHAVALLTTIGRAGLGSSAALASRYTSFMLVGWLLVVCGLLEAIHRRSESVVPERRSVRLLAGLSVVLALVLGLSISAGKLVQVATWTIPQQARGAACLDVVLRDPRQLEARRPCLEALYPDPERLLEIARRLPLR